MPPKPAQATATANPLKPRGLPQTIAALLQTQQFYWFLGHVSVLVSFVLHSVTAFFSRSTFYYKFTLLSVLFTYTIVLRQLHFRTLSALRSPNLRAGLLKDENFHYFMLALVFFVTHPVTGPLSGLIYSFTIFSLFHSLTYFQNSLLSSLPISLSAQQTLNTRINNFTTQYNEPALMIASNSELLLLTTFVFSLPFTPVYLFKAPLYAITNLFVFGVVIVFLKLRYDLNKYTQLVINSWDLRITQFLFSPQAAMIPNSVRNGYQIQFKTLLHRYLGPISVPNLIRITGGAAGGSRKQN